MYIRQQKHQMDKKNLLRNKPTSNKQYATKHSYLDRNEKVVTCCTDIG